MKIEKYESKVKPSTDLDAAPASAGAFTASGRAIEESGRVLGEIGQRMTQAQAFQERTTAANKARGELADLVFKAKNDPDPKNHDTYIKEISRIREGSARGLSLRSARLEFDQDFGSMANSALMDIKQDQRTKVVNLGLAALDGGLKQMAALYVQTPDPRRQKELLDQMDAQIDEAALRGFITPDKAQAMKDKNYAAIGVDKFYSDLSSISTPAQADQLTESLRKGYYEQNGVTIDPEKKKAMYEQAEKYRNKFEKESAAAQEITFDQNMRKAMLEMFKGELTLSELQRRYTAGEIKESDYNTLERKLVTADYALLAGNMSEGKAALQISNHETFNAIRQAQLDGSKTPGQISRMILQASADQKLTNLDGDYLERMNSKMEPNPKDQQIVSAANSVKDWATRYIKSGVIDEMTGGKQKASRVEEILNEFYRRVDTTNPADDEAIQEIGRRVIQDNMKRDYPELHRLEDVPHVVVDIGGKVRQMLTPDRKTTLKPKYRLVAAQTGPEPQEGTKKK